MSPVPRSLPKDWPQTWHTDIFVCCGRNEWFMGSAPGQVEPRGPCGHLLLFQHHPEGPFRAMWVGPHLHHQGLLMGALNYGQDSVQLLSGHVV